MQDEPEEIKINIYALSGWVGMIMMGGILVHQLMLGLPGLPSLGYAEYPLTIAASILLVFSACLLTSSGPLLVRVPKYQSRDSHQSQSDEHE